MRADGNNRSSRSSTGAGTASPPSVICASGSTRAVSSSIRPATKRQNVGVALACVTPRSRIAATPSRGWFEPGTTSVARLERTWISTCTPANWLRLYARSQRAPGASSGCFTAATNRYQSWRTPRGSPVVPVVRISAGARGGGSRRASPSRARSSGERTPTPSSVSGSTCHDDAVIEPLRIRRRSPLRRDRTGRRRPRPPRPSTRRAAGGRPPRARRRRTVRWIGRASHGPAIGSVRGRWHTSACRRT